MCHLIHINMNAIDIFSESLAYKFNFVVGVTNAHNSHISHLMFNYGLIVCNQIGYNSVTYLNLVTYQTIDNLDV